MIALVGMAAAASPLCGEGGRLAGPAHVPSLEGALGAVRTPCASTHVALDVGGGLLADTADFYGRIQGVAALDAALLLSKRSTLTGRLEAFRYESILAPVAVGSTGLGTVSIGATTLLHQSDEQVFSLHAQIVFPTLGYENALPLGIDAGMTAIRQWGRGDLHASIVAFGQLPLRGPAVKGGLNTRVGMTRHLTENGVSWVLDIPLELGWVGPVDSLGVATSLRFGTRSGWMGEFGVHAPLIGSDRTLARLNGRFGYRFK